MHVCTSTYTQTLTNIIWAEKLRENVIYYKTMHQLQMILQPTHLKVYFTAFDTCLCPKYFSLLHAFCKWKLTSSWHSAYASKCLSDPQWSSRHLNIFFSNRVLVSTWAALLSSSHSSLFLPELSTLLVKNETILSFHCSSLLCTRTAFVSSNSAELASVLSD